MLYVQNTTKPGRHGGKAVALGHFLSIDAVRHVDVVPWYITLDKQVRVGLVQFLEETPKLKLMKIKCTVSDVSPDESKRLLLQQPLISIQSQHNKAQPLVMCYVLDGRAGKIALSSNGLILVRKL